ncbi:phosphonoacetaldehyde hydrolase [Planctomicrobium sp. SH661]|uniref:phosphonoacetaldehyde hydrolase n=1 Tax=Planctomicrobium sp. SH661 TaxID=3448124 RepID=UPI003F5C6CD0
MTDFQQQRLRAGKVQAVILDWAGTTVDFGSCAPAQVFREIFVREGIDVTEAQARGPMGLAKREHIATVLAIPEVAAMWKKAKGRESTESDIDDLYERFLPLQREVLQAHSQVIPGAVESQQWMRERGIKVGSTTGYTRSLMEVVVPAAAKAGYSPEAVVCSDEVPQGRPAPWMLFLASQRLNVFPMASVVAVDDTLLGIDAGLNAGCWTIAVVATGNEMALSLQDFDRLPAEERVGRSEKIRAHFLEGGAHLAIDSVAELPTAIETIESWIQAGRRP